MARLAPVVAALAFLLAACSTPSSGAAGGAALSITLSEFKYSPTQLDVAAGVPFTLGLKNAGTIDHNFTIEKTGLKVELTPGASAQREIGALAAGIYEYVCTVPGHKEAGMVGKLLVK